MKQVLLKTWLIVVCLLALGGGRVWADSSKWTFSSCATTANNKPVNTELNATVAPSTETGKWTAACSANSYANTLSGGGVQLGSSSYKFNGTITLSNTNIPAAAKITSVVVNGKSGGTYTVTCKVNGVSYGSSQTVTGSTATDYTFSGNATGNQIELTTSTSANKYIGIVSITVNYTLEQATITLSEVGNESNVSGTHYAGDKYTLPTSTSYECGTKELVGWSNIEVEETDTKPTSNYYAKGETVELNAGTNVFYAVFANVTPGGQDDATLSISYSQNTAPTGWTINDRGWNTGYWGLANGETYNIESPVIDDLSTIKSIKVNTRTYGSTSGKSNVLEVYSGSTTYGTQTASSTFTNYTITKTNTLTGSGSVCFKSQGTVDGSGLRVTDIVIEYTVDGTLYSGYTTSAPAPTTGSFKIGSKGFGTYFTDKAYTMPEGVTGGVYTMNDSDVELTWYYEAGETVPANEALILKGTAGTTYDYDIVFGDESAVTGGNLLMGCLVATPAFELTGLGTESEVNELYSFYKLASSDDNTKYGWFYGATDGASFTCNANKCVLVLEKVADTPSNRRALTLIGDVVNGIDTMTVEQYNAIYDLQGRRVKAANKGMYVVNGKKIIK